MLDKNAILRALDALADVLLVDSPIHQFCRERCYYVPGALMKFSEFYSRFEDWSEARAIPILAKVIVSQGLPTKYPVGAHNGNVHYVANLAWEPGPAIAEPMKQNGNRVRGSRPTARQTILRMRGEGKSLGQIATFLNAQGYRSQRNKRWHKTSVNRIINATV